MPELTTQEILRKAADVIRGNGWWQLDYYELDDRSANECKVCALGAIAVAAGCDVFNADHFFLHPASDAEKAAVAAARVLAEHIQGSDIDLSLFVPVVGDWNDNPDRTESQVIAALLVAAGGEA